MSALQSLRSRRPGSWYTVRVSFIKLCYTKLPFLAVLVTLLFSLSSSSISRALFCFRDCIIFLLRSFFIDICYFRDLLAHSPKWQFFVCHKMLVTCMIFCILLVAGYMKAEWTFTLQYGILREMCFFAYSTLVSSGYSWERTLWP